MIDVCIVINSFHVMRAIIENQEAQSFFGKVFLGASIRLSFPLVLI